MNEKTFIYDIFQYFTVFYLNCQRKSDTAANGTLRVDILKRPIFQL